MCYEVKPCRLLDAAFSDTGPYVRIEASLQLSYQLIRVYLLRTKQLILSAILLQVFSQDTTRTGNVHNVIQSTHSFQSQVDLLSQVDLHQINKLVSHLSLGLYVTVNFLET